MLHTGITYPPENSHFILQVLALVYKCMYSQRHVQTFLREHKAHAKLLGNSDYAQKVAIKENEWLQYGYLFVVNFSLKGLHSLERNPSSLPPTQYACASRMVLSA